MVLLALTVAFGADWFAVERRAEHPLVDLRILRARGVWTTSITSAAPGASYSAMYFLVPQLLSAPPFSATAGDISLYLFPTVMVSIVVGPLSGLLVRRAGARAVVAAGQVLTAAGTLFAAG